MPEQVKSNHPRPWQYGTRADTKNKQWCPYCRRYRKHVKHEITDDTPGFRESWDEYECGHGHF